MAPDFGMSPNATTSAPRDERTNGGKNTSGVETERDAGGAQARRKELREIRGEQPEYAAVEQSQQGQQREQRLVIPGRQKDDRQDDHVADATQGECRAPVDQFGQAGKQQPLSRLAQFVPQ